MYARVTTLEVPPERVDEFTRFNQEQILPQVRQLQGFKGTLLVGDPQSGRMRGTFLWESAEALRGSAEAAAGLPSSLVEATGAEVVSVEEYEVSLFQLSLLP